MSVNAAAHNNIMVFLNDSYAKTKTVMDKLIVLIKEYSRCADNRRAQIGDEVRQLEKEHEKLHADYMAFRATLSAVDRLILDSGCRLDVALATTIARECGDKDDPIRAYLVKVTGYVSDLMELNMKPLGVGERRHVQVSLAEHEYLCRTMQRISDHASEPFGMLRDTHLVHSIQNIKMDTANNNNNNNTTTAAAVEAVIVNHRNGTPSRPMTAVLMELDYDIGVLNQRLEDTTDQAERNRVMKEVIDKNVQRNATKKLITEVEAPVVNFIANMANNTIVRDRDPPSLIQPEPEVPRTKSTPTRLLRIGGACVPPSTPYAATKIVSGVSVVALHGHPAISFGVRCLKCGAVVYHYFNMFISTTGGLDIKTGKWSPEFVFDPVDEVCDECKKKK
jgi:uncharacterized Zn-binding protein involved in type VI secretion